MNEQDLGDHDRWIELNKQANRQTNKQTEKSDMTAHL